MKVEISTIYKVGNFKIPIIKLLRGAFDLSLKDAKELADKLEVTPVIQFNSKSTIGIAELNRSFALRNNKRILEYKAVNTQDRIKEECSTKVKNFMDRVPTIVKYALKNNEIQLAKALIDAYVLFNKSQQ